MLHKYVDILAQCVQENIPSKLAIASIARQNAEGVQIIENAYAGIDLSHARGGYIAFNAEDDITFDLAENQVSSRKDLYDVVSDLKLVLWHQESCALKLATFLAAKMNDCSRMFEFIPKAVSTNTPEIFKAETGKEDGPRGEVQLIKIQFEIKFKATLVQCVEYQKGGCDGC